MKSSSDKIYYLEYFSVIFLVLSFIVLVSAVLNHKKNKQQGIDKQKCYKNYNENFENSAVKEPKNINTKYQEHIAVLKKLGFEILDVNLSSTVASVYVDKNPIAYKKLKELYTKCVIIELNNKYQVFIDYLFEQKNIQSHAVANMQGKYDVQYIILNTDGSWKVKINDVIYTKDSAFLYGFRIIEVSDSQVIIETDNGQVYKIVL